MIITVSFDDFRYYKKQSLIFLALLIFSFQSYSQTFGQTKIRETNLSLNSQLRRNSDLQSLTLPEQRVTLENKDSATMLIIRSRHLPVEVENRLNLIDLDPIRNSERILLATPGVEMPAKIPPHSVPGKNENRGQNNIANSQAIKILLAKNEVPPVIKPAWGGEYSECDRSLAKLRALGRTGTYTKPLNAAQQNAEKDFVTACLSPLPAEIESRVSRIVISGQTVCTMLLIHGNLGVTARHCFYDRYQNPSNRQYMYRARFSELNVVTAEVGAVASAKSAQIAKLWLLKQQATGAAWLEGKYPASPNIGAEDQLNDIVAVELVNSIASSALPKIPLAQADINDRIVLPAFHSPYQLDGRANDSGLRIQTKGFCQIFQPANSSRCMIHACSTTPGSSGAPILIERDDGNGKNLFFAGIHVGGSREESSCKADGILDGIVNFGIGINGNEYAQLMDLK